MLKYKVGKPGYGKGKGATSDTPNDAVMMTYIFSGAARTFAMPGSNILEGYCRIGVYIQKSCHAQAKFPSAKIFRSLQKTRHSRLFELLFSK